VCVALHTWRPNLSHDLLRVRGEMMGPGKYESVGKSQPVLVMINPMISPRIRTVDSSDGADRLAGMHRSAAP
jgi:hypothetical protein